jgi:hypothetical protein
MARQGSQLLDKTIEVFPAPDAYLASIRQAAGTRFAADAMFMGENRPFGARLTYSVSGVGDEKSNDGGEADSSGEEEEVVTIEIFNSDGELIRTLKDTPGHAGVNRTTWGLERKGVRGPSRRQPRPDADEPSGPDVLPGVYKVKMTYRGESDSTQVRVHFDPRIEYDMEDLEARQAMELELMALTQKAADATNRLLKALEMIETTEALMKSAKENGSSERFEKLEAETKQIKKTLNTLLDHMVGKEDDRQGITRNPDPSVVSYLRQPGRYLGSAIGGPDATERILMRKAREAVEKGVARISDFFNSDWSEYVKVVETANLSPVMDIEVAKTD